jgi:hypothetical protein
MNKFVIELECGNYAIIQSCSALNLDKISATIGIILPNRKCMEFLDIDNWVATYNGVSQSVKKGLLDAYNKNKAVIKNKIMKFAV